MGERPMLSPHVQSNAQMYNYHQPNHQSNTRLSQQQQRIPPMSYYNNNNGVVPTTAPQPPVNGCMNVGDMERRQSIERLAAISRPPDQYNHPQQQQKISPTPSNTAPTPTANNMIAPQSHYYPPQQALPASGMTTPAVPAVQQHQSHQPHRKPVPPPNNTSQHTAQSHSDNSESSTAPQPETTTNTQMTITSKTLSPQSNHANQPSDSAGVTTASTAVSLENLPPSDPQPTLPGLVTATSHISASKEHAEDCTEEGDDDLDQPKVETAALDSGIDSEQVDKDNEEEHDTSTTSNKSENSPHPVDKISSGVDESMDTAESGKGSRRTSSIAAASPAASLPSPASLCNKSESVASPIHEHTRQLHADYDTISEESQSESQLADMENTAELPANAPSLDDSFQSVSSTDKLANSFSSSATSRKSMGDESRLPPRKRKQNFSEHTDSIKVAMPPKKRGRPTKEAVRLREAAQVAEAIRLANRMAAESAANVTPAVTVKERKSSTSSNKQKLNKTVHSGNLLHSPKLNLGGVKTPKDHQLTANNLLSKATIINNKTPDCDSQEIQSPNEIHIKPQSNAIIISPPKKPKASVSEMQKALMRVVSSDTGVGEVRKRGRPVGSKNKKSKTTDFRARSNSTSSSSKGQPSVPNMSNGLLETPTGSTVEFPVSTPDDGAAILPVNSSKPEETSSQSQKLSSSVHKRAKSLHIRKSKVISPPRLGGSVAELRLPTSTDQWACAYCQQISNFGTMGDLFGGYNVIPNQPLVAKAITSKKSTDIHQTKENAGRPPNEVWFHEKCIIWAPGVYMVDGKLYGVYESLTTASQTVSSIHMLMLVLLKCRM